jgi:hypothetical protein
VCKSRNKIINGEGQADVQEEQTRSEKRNVMS